GGSRDSAVDQVFERRRRMTLLQERIYALEDEANELEQRLVGEEAALESVEAEIGRCDGTVKRLEMKEAGLRRDLDQISANLNTADKRLGILGRECENRNLQKDDLEKRTRLTREALASVEARREVQEHEDAEARNTLELMIHSASEELKRSGDIRARAAQLEERLASVEREYKAAQDRQKKAEKQLRSLAREMDRSIQERSATEDRLADAMEREKAVMHVHKMQSQTILELKAKSESLAEAINELESRDREVQRSIKELSEAVHRSEVESVRLNQLLEGMVEKIVERYGTDPRTVRPPAEAPDEAALALMRRDLEAMGEVNLAAITERRPAEERLAFLKAQEEDLKDSVNILYETIEKIDKTTSERFEEAFHKVNNKFQEIFPVLFRGGEARLELTDDEDLLETGVEIMARPPGKTVRIMDLLSGGEKALTAVALIFSIFLIRPSPFCLLDEVDAPLDDSNIVRFNDMLRRLSQDTQFLVVTHNKRTMAAADALYGITIEDPGVSRVVSVRFRD
ncbi:MAG: hypothetical protein V2B18_14950, partial [Pseudomonadota bacterium]